MGGRIFLQGDDVCGWVESGCHGDKQVVVHSIARQVHNYIQENGTTFLRSCHSLEIL